MKERFEGEAGKRRLIEALIAQKMVGANRELAIELCGLVEIIEVEAGELIIEQDAEDDDLYLILTGAFDILVNGKIVARRYPNDHVGEMAAVQPIQRRSATVIATERSVVAKLSEPQLAELGDKYPEMYRYIAKELARRLEQRNSQVNAARDKIQVFIISSAEALPIARAIQNAFEHDPFSTVIWTDGVFWVSNYAIESLEEQLNQSDFAIAIAKPDDQVESRGKPAGAPRDNVIFELGYFMGRLGRQRAILMEPRGEEVKLPSDLAGITTVPYKFGDGKNLVATMAPACNKLRDYIMRLGPNN